MAAFDNGNTVFGYFSSEAQAEAAVRELYTAGFTYNQISLAGRPDDETVYGSAPTGTESKLHREGRKAGEAAGGFWGRVKGFFEGEGAEPYADERTRGELATHEISNTGDVYDYDDDFHQSWGAGTTDRSRYFTDQYNRTGEGVVVSVNAGDRRTEAESILQANGADLGTSATTGSTAGYSATDAGDAERSTADVQSPRRIQLYGEVLRVHRDRVQRGEVRLRKETVTETQNLQVPVSREEIVIERVPVSGEQAATGVTVGSENEEIRIPLSEDRVRIEKEPVVREQVEVGKREITNNETRQETIRREELRVDNEGDRLRKAS